VRAVHDELAPVRESQAVRAHIRPSQVRYAPPW
jgi:hypothetical protein